MPAETLISLNQERQPAGRWRQGRQRLGQWVLHDKLSGGGGVLVFALSALIIAYLVAQFQVLGVALFGVSILVVPAVYALLAYPKLGIMILLSFAFSIMFLLRLGVPFPLGTLMDGIEVLLLLGLLVQLRAKKDWKRFANPVSYAVLVWIGYNLIQFANPVAESRLAWVYTIRTVAFVMITYFIFTYHLNSKAFIRLVFKLWLGVMAFAAAYAFKQQHFDFFAFEKAWLNSDPNIAQLLFIDGQWRKFSIFSDPVAFSYNMVMASILCIVLMGSKHTRLWKKIALGALTGWLLLNMLYSGTRGAYVLLPAAMVLYFILNFSRKVLVVGSIGAFLMAVMIFIPTSNPTIVRFQTAFRPNEDASFNVRKANQKRIQPYIWSHPIGGGLGATGTWGQRFSPNSFLAKFPPDSGYVRVAVELGWIGLLIFCTLMFLILRQGINHYYLIKDPQLKSWCLAATLVVFAFNVGNYPQEAIVQYPSNILFYLATALIMATRHLDLQQQEQAYAKS